MDFSIADDGSAYTPAPLRGTGEVGGEPPGRGQTGTAITGPERPSFIFFSEAHPRRTVSEFVAYVNEARTHQGIDNIPGVVAGRITRRHPPPAESGHLVARSVLGGLAHDYRLTA